MGRAGDAEKVVDHFEFETNSESFARVADKKLTLPAL